MPQTTSALSAKDTAIEFSVDGTTWTNISGSASSVEPSEQSRMSGEAYTFDGDEAIVTGGKKEPIEVVVKTIYTETAGEAFEVVRTQHESTGVGYIRYSVRGSTTGNRRFTSAKGVITGFTYPSGDAGDGKPVMAGFKLKTPKFTGALIP